jgi:hypothetical protein
MHRSHLISRGVFSSSIWIAATLALAACGEVDDPNYRMPAGPALAGDAQVAVDAGAAPPATGGGGMVTPPAMGNPQVPVDAGVPTNPQTMLDAQVPVVDAGAFADASIGDASVEGGLPPRMDLGKGNGKDVITIGDSWMLLFFTGIQESLVKASGNQPYRKYAVPGTRLLDGVIPGQYDSAKRADPNIKTVVMTGGGNDIIQNTALEMDCAAGGPMCQAQLDKIGTALSDLWAKMSKDGVQDVIHVMYSASAGSGVKNRAENNKKLAESCAAVPGPMRCHLLNTDELIKKEDLADEVHPNSAGYDRIGQAVFDLMVKEGMRR